MVPTIETKVKFDGDISPIKILFKECKWDWIEPDSEMLIAFQNSYRIYMVYNFQTLIGFSRIISDGKTYGHLVDLMISPNYRRKGYGRLLIEHILLDSKNNGIKIIQLLASKEGRHLYQDNGFEVCSNEAPGMIKIL